MERGLFSELRSELLGWLKGTSLEVPRFATIFEGEKNCLVPPPPGLLGTQFFSELGASQRITIGGLLAGDFFTRPFRGQLYCIDAEFLNQIFF